MTAGKRRSRAHTLLLALTLISVVAACSTSGSEGEPTRSAGGPSTSATSAPRHGGTLVVLNDAAQAGAWTTGLDPAKMRNTNFVQAQAIFGGLFELRAKPDGSGAHIVGNQAASGEVSPDGMTLTVKLRPGITFTDGTPLDAKAVIWNWKRDTKSPESTTPQWKLRSNNPFTAPDSRTVVVHFSEPNVAVLHHMPDSNINWIVSPTAFKKMGPQQFKLKPVGAGPFTVVSNTPSSKLVLKRNPNYFKEDQPYLDKLVFKSIGGDQPAYQALLAGQADVYERATLLPVIRQAQQHKDLNVTLQPGVAPYFVQLNTTKPPFDNKKAREAIYYATNWKAINEGLFNGQRTVLQGFTAPAGLFYHETTPGYRTFDLAKAKKIVKKLGGLNVRIDSLSNFTNKKIITALQTQWQKAGIQVTTRTEQINKLIQVYHTGDWQASLLTAGSWDPAVGLGVNLRFESSSPYTGVKDPRLDELLNKAESTPELAQRDTFYQQAAKHISDQAYAPFGFAVPTAQITVDGVHGPGLTTKIPPIGQVTGVVWGEVWKEKD